MKKPGNHSAARIRSARAVTFDVTGTLISSPHLASLYRQVLTRHGYSVSAEELSPKLDWVWKELSCRTDLAHRDRFTGHAGGVRGFWHRYLERLCEHLDLRPPTRFASAELYQIFARASSWRVYDDAIPALERLKSNGLRLAVVSNWDERLSALLADLGLADHFEVIVTSSSCGVEKPSARIWNECLRRLDVKAEETLHVGDDKVVDFEGAQAAGLDAWHLDREGGATLEDIPGIRLQSGPRRVL